MLPFIAFGVATAAASDAIAQKPIRNGGTLTGQLRLVRTKHPNGTLINAFQIVSAPRKMPADDLFCSHTACHIGDAVVLKWSALAPR